MVDEYEELRQLRVLWSKVLTTREHIMIPAMLGLIGVTISQIPNFPEEYVFHFLYAEGMILIIAGLYWRRLGKHVDNAIVGLYGRMLELEKRNGMDIQTRYYYSNLKKQIRAEMLFKYNISCTEQLPFEKFKEIANKKHSHYDILIEIWNQFQHKSVGSRGHAINDVFAGSIIGLYWLGIILWSSGIFEYIIEITNSHVLN